MDVQYTPELFGQAQTQSETVPNDDLDLQVLWLEVIEKNGPNFTSEDLAKAFYEKCPYAPANTPHSKKITSSGFGLRLQAPLTIIIIWREWRPHPRRDLGLPGAGRTASCRGARRKGRLSRSQGESVIAEQYVAVLEALAFTGKYDIQTLVVKALTYIDEHSRFYQMAGRVIELCSRTKDWKQILTLILRDYGHPGLHKSVPKHGNYSDGASARMREFYHYRNAGAQLRV